MKNRGEIDLYAILSVCDAILSVCAVGLIAWAGIYVLYSWAASSLRAALAVLP